MSPLFPAKRSLRKTAKFTMEIALLADGVKREDVYRVLATPEGVERVFNKLDQLKPNIQWWESGAQPLQWLVSGDVVMGSVYNGRVGSALKEGHDFRMVWTDSIYDMDSWTIVKGSKKSIGRTIYRLCQLSGKSESLCRKYRLWPDQYQRHLDD